MRKPSFQATRHWSMRPLLPSRVNRCAAGMLPPTDCVSGAVKSCHGGPHTAGAAEREEAHQHQRHRAGAQRPAGPGVGARTGAAMSRRSRRSNAARSAAAITAKTTEHDRDPVAVGERVRARRGGVEARYAERDEGGRPDGRGERRDGARGGPGTDRDDDDQKPEDAHGDGTAGNGEDQGRRSERSHRGGQYAHPLALGRA